MRYLLVISVAMALGACGTSELFGVYDVPEAPGTAEAPWPRLVDTPDAPPPGTYTDAVPDPATGIATSTQLTLVSGAASSRAGAPSEPVVDEQSLAARAAAAQLRAQRLSAPVITDAERQRLLAATR